MVAAWRAFALNQPQGLESWTEPQAGPTTLVPDLATDDNLRLSWLPGVGSYRAEQIVAERPFLQVPLTPPRLALLPGVGERTARQVDRWYRRQPPMP
jgi:DNA uptake protein ComE-like DNA-binding protein